MTVRVRLVVNRRRVKYMGLLAGCALPLALGAAWLRPAAPPAFDFYEFDREMAAAKVSAQQGTRVEARESGGNSGGNVQELDKKINGALVVYGASGGAVKR